MAQNMSFQPLDPAMASATHDLAVVSCIYVIVNLMFVVGDLSALFRPKSWYHKRNDNPKARKVFFMRCLLFGSAVAKVANSLLVGLTAIAVPFTWGIDACTWIVKGYSIGYTISLQLVFIFFIIRSSFVEGLIRTPAFNLVSRISKVGLMFFLPAFVVPYTLAAVNGYLTPDGVCICMNINLWFSVLLIVGNALLHGVTIYLFTAPLKRSIAASPPDKTATIKRVMYRNIFFNTLAVIGTVVCLSLFTIYNQRLVLDYHTVLGIAFSTSDLFIIGICSRGMLIEEKSMKALYEMLEYGGTVRQTILMCLGCCAPERIVSGILTDPKSSGAVRPADEEEPLVDTMVFRHKSTLPTPSSALELALE